MTTLSSREQSGEGKRNIQKSLLQGLVPLEHLDPDHRGNRFVVLHQDSLLPPLGYFDERGDPEPSGLGDRDQLRCIQGGHKFVLLICYAIPCRITGRLTGG